MAVVHQIFAEARAHPERTAVVFDGHVLTYAFFARCIAAARDWLAGQAIPGVAVICVQSLLEAWVFGLALRSLGRDTVTVRVAADIAQLDVTGLGCIVTTRAEAGGALAAVAADLGLALIAAPDEVGDAAQGEGAIPALDAGAPTGGHILLTSGTTGVFKAVLIDAVSEVANARRRAELYGMDRGSSVALFDFGGWTSAGYNIALCAWGVGGAVVIRQAPGPDLALHYPALTHAVLTPHILQAVLAAPAIPRRQGLRLIVISGALSRTAWEAARARITDQVFTNLGATETGPFSMTLIETPEDLRWHGVHPSREAQVVDDDDRPLPAGELGVMRIRIVDTVTGYQGDPATSAAFFRDGWFYPGDLAQTRADGRIGLFGRVTDVINIGGSKFPTAPIEEALRDALGIEGVCVFSAQNAGAEEEAHVALETEGPIADATLAPALRAALRGFARVHVHYLSEMPRTSTGKVQRGALKTLLAVG